MSHYLGLNKDQFAVPSLQHQVQNQIAQFKETVINLVTKSLKILLNEGVENHKFPLTHF
jgi:hypothetical protein